MRNYQKIRNGYCYANKKSRLYDTMYVYIYIILYYTNMHSKYIVCIVHIHILQLILSNNAIYVIAILFFSKISNLYNFYNYYNTFKKHI